MSSTKIRYTASLPQSFLDDLKEMAKDKRVPSVNYAITEALAEYLKNRKTAQYHALMQEAGSDESFIARTMRCAEDFAHIDSEASETW